MEIYIVLAVIAVLCFIIIRQQRIIDRLNDRLMARSYVEYVSKQIKEEDASPKEEYEPLSYFDQ